MLRLGWALILVCCAAEAREPFVRTSIREVLVTKHPAELAEERVPFTVTHG